jgi:hypothetical protein
MLISLFPLLRYPYPFLLSGLPTLFLHQIFIWDVKHIVDIFACGGNGIKLSAFRLYWSLQKCNLIGFEQLQNITRHFSLHLVKLSMLCRSIHLEWLAISIIVLRLPSEGSSKPTGMLEHVVVLLVHL